MGMESIARDIAKQMKKIFWDDLFGKALKPFIWLIDTLVTLFKSFHHAILALPIMLLLLVVGTPLRYICRVAMCILSWILITLFTLWSLLGVTVLYIVITIGAFICAVFDIIFKGHISPSIRKRISCTAIASNWFDVKFGHIGNKFTARKVAGICWACLKPCPLNSFPTKGAKSLRCERGKGRKMYVKPYSRTAAMMNYLQRNTVYKNDVEMDDFSHTPYAPIGVAIGKYFEYFGAKRPREMLRNVTTTVFPTQHDIVSRQYQSSSIEQVLSNPSLNIASIYVIVIVVTILFFVVLIIYNKIRFPV